ncbi:MAG: hypothetical protein ACJAZJ_000827 [Candidatus Endobugula sp.]
MADFSGVGLQREQLESEGIVFTAAGLIPKRYFW